MFYHCQNESWKLEVTRRKYFSVCILIIASVSQQIPGLSRTINLNLKDFPEPKSFSRTFQVLEILQKHCRTFQEAWKPWFITDIISRLIAQEQTTAEQPQARGYNATFYTTGIAEV